MKKAANIITKAMVKELFSPTTKKPAKNDTKPVHPERAVSFEMVSKVVKPMPIDIPSTSRDILKLEIRAYVNSDGGYTLTGVTIPPLPEDTIIEFVYPGDEPDCTETTHCYVQKSGEFRNWGIDKEEWKRMSSGMTISFPLIIK